MTSAGPFATLRLRHQTGSDFMSEDLSGLAFNIDAQAPFTFGIGLEGELVVGFSLSGIRAHIVIPAEELGTLERGLERSLNHSGCVIRKSATTRASLRRCIIYYQLRFVLHPEIPRSPRLATGAGWPAPAPSTSSPSRVWVAAACSAPAAMPQLYTSIREARVSPRCNSWVKHASRRDRRIPARQNL